MSPEPSIAAIALFFAFFVVQPTDKTREAVR